MMATVTHVYDGIWDYMCMNGTGYGWVQDWALNVLYTNSKLEIDQGMHNDSGPPWPPHYKNY